MDVSDVPYWKTSKHVIFMSWGFFDLKVIITECLMKNENMSYEVIRDHTSMLLIIALHIQKY